MRQKLCRSPAPPGGGGRCRRCATPLPRFSLAQHQQQPSSRRPPGRADAACPCPPCRRRHGRAAAGASRCPAARRAQGARARRAAACQRHAGLFARRRAWRSSRLSALPGPLRPLCANDLGLLEQEDALCERARAASGRWVRCCCCRRCAATGRFVGPPNFWRQPPLQPYAVSHVQSSQLTVHKQAANPSLLAHCRRRPAPAPQRLLEMRCRLVDAIGGARRAGRQLRIHWARPVGARCALLPGVLPAAWRAGALAVRCMGGSAAARQPHPHPFPRL